MHVSFRRKERRCFEQAACKPQYKNCEPSFSCPRSYPAPRTRSFSPPSYFPEQHLNPEAKMCITPLHYSCGAVEHTRCTPLSSTSRNLPIPPVARASMIRADIVDDEPHLCPCPEMLDPVYTNPPKPVDEESKKYKEWMDEEAGGTVCDLCGWVSAREKCFLWERTREVGHLASTWAEEGAGKVEQDKPKDKEVAQEKGEGNLGQINESDILRLRTTSPTKTPTMTEPSRGAISIDDALSAATNEKIGTAARFRSVGHGTGQASGGQKTVADEGVGCSQASGMSNREVMDMLKRAASAEQAEEEKTDEGG
jgi:hypothetical protein